MRKAGGYILILSSKRRAAFESSLEVGAAFAEPVPEFNHSRGLPLVCFIITQTGFITHLALGKRGLRAGTQMRRLNFNEISALRIPIPLETIVEQLPKKTKRFAQECVRTGGLLTPKSFEDVVDAIRNASPETRALLDRFSQERAARISRLSPEIIHALAEQKEAVITALSIAGLSRDTLQQWTPREEGTPTSFLEGLPTARLREDPMVIHDMQHLPGYDLIKALPYSAAIFQSESRRLTLILANRQPLEQQLGTDLIYFNENYSSFVMVQYKAMEDEDGEAAFRLPNRQLSEEIARMDTVLKELRRCDPNESRDGYRLNENPFFLKLCPRIVFNPDDVRLVPGLYLPLEYWRLLEQDPAIDGPRGGKLVTYKNVGRYFDNSDFVTLVENAWIGTTAKQSEELKSLIREILEAGRAVAFAIKTDEPDPPSISIQQSAQYVTKEKETEKVVVRIKT